MLCGSEPELYFKKLNHKADVFQEYQKLITTTEPEKIDAFFDKYLCDYACISKKFFFKFILIHARELGRRL